MSTGVHTGQPRNRTVRAGPVTATGFEEPVEFAHQCAKSGYPR
ncbi:hypothetical protein ACWD1Y_14575 [Streptomyces sp. NPDC002814]|nr:MULTISPECIES: hypothetical protein [unclassified Streptomyces]